MDGETAHLKERKSRKSVTFDSEQIIVDADGSVTMVNSADGTKDTAMSHTPQTPPLSAALKASSPLSEAAPAGDDVPDDGGLDPSLMKKKKKKKTTGEEDAGDDGDAAGGEDGLDLSIKKKKKKKAVKKEGDEDEFAAKIKALEIDDKEKATDDGDMDLGTGIWAPSETRTIAYNPLLTRLYKLILEKDPDHAMGGPKSYKIVPPQCMREGNKKTIFTNIADMCARMRRTEEHVTAYLFAELGTTGSVDGSRRLVIKGRFQQKQIENVLRKYIIEYVTCKTCKSPDTELNKGENRLYFVTCNSCGSRRSVTAIKTGFSAQVGKRRKMQ